MPATTDLPSPTNTTYPPGFASAATCLSSWSSWNDAVTAYTSESYGTWSIVTPAATLTGHVYYTTPAPSTYSAPPCPFDYADICQSLQGYSIIGSEPTTFVVPATTDFSSGLIPASVLVTTPACTIGAPACSALLSAGLVLFYDGDVVDWRNCQMTPPGIGPVALTPTDFLVAPPTAAPTTTTSSSPTSHPSKPTPSATALPQPTLNYLIPAPALLATNPATTTTIAPSHLAPPSPPISTLTLVVTPASANPYTTRIALPPPPPPPPPSTPLATVAGQTVVFDPARDAAAVFVGAFPIKAGGPAVADGGGGGGGGADGGGGRDG
ncbi:2-nitropropane dioxygenase [Neofusicoccum parvum]|uniref:2-nitropropane dioxygenase n=1 Tax=Neofusicoccum parvum TaxID=310453 RepID=A0ACB5RXU3_9PEZI|nr:2-nitropropane dioxygenase [Neofusicoccum parvum]